MDINFDYWNTEEIAKLLSKANFSLQESLLNGSEWKDIIEKRRIYTESAIALHKREKPEDFGVNPE
ncbi:MAG: hypothetical protein ACJ748_08865 [Flavisolibacter sp.]|jgi:hypothetical protein